MFWTSFRRRPRRAAGRFASSFRGALGRRPLFETLELRRMLANYTWDNAADTLLIALGNDESLTVSESSGTVSFALSAGTFTQSGGNTASGDGTPTITITASDLASSVAVSNSTVTAGTNNVTFSGDGSLSSATIAVNMADTEAVGTISFIGGFDLASTGAGGITLETNRNIAVGVGTVISTGAGDITLRANRQATPTGGDFVGIDVSDTTITTSGTGDILLEGRGGNSSANFGIRLLAGAVVESTSMAANAGAITLNGISAGSSGILNSGVFLTGANTKVSSVSGAIEITGQGGSGSGGFNRGIHVTFGAVVKSTGETDGAAITLHGTGGDGNDGNNNGVDLGNAQVSSVSGAIEITGQGGNGFNGVNSGIQIGGSAVVESTGETDGATITLDGIGGTGAGGNAGVRLVNANTKVSSVSGAIEITGQRGDGTFFSGTQGILVNTAAVTSTGSANVTLTSDSIDLVTNAIQAGANTVTLRTKTTGGTVGINLGGDDAVGTLGLSNAELDRITAGKIVIGEAATPNTITVSAAIEHAGDADIVVVTARNIAFNSGTSWTTIDGDLTFRANRQATPTSGPFIGIEVRGAITTGGAGNILFEGRGGNSGHANYGVLLGSDGVVESTATDPSAGTIIFDGTGGLGTGGNRGVEIVGTITSVDGDIEITGQAGGDGTDGANIGVLIFGPSSKISSTGTGSDAAKITINGTGGNGTNGNDGVLIDNGEVTSKDGDIQITGEQGSSSLGIVFLSVFLNASITSTGTADIGLTSDSIDFGPSPESHINAGANTVTLKTKTTDGTVGIDIGGADSGSALGLTDFELDRVVAGKIVIGDAATPNTVTVSAAIQHAGDADFEVVTARNIVFNIGTSWTSTDGDLTFRANRQATPTGGNFVGISVSGTITTGGTGNILLEGRGGMGGDFNNGIDIENGARVESTSMAANAGTITLDGQGGSGDSRNYGVALSDDAQVTSVSGAIAITGQGGSGPSGNNDGIRLSNGAVVESTGETGGATITLDGVGGTGGDNSGVRLMNVDTRVSSVSGDIEIIGQQGDGDFSGGAYGIRIANAEVASTGSANITLTSDSIERTTVVLIAAGANTVTLRTKTTDGTVGIDIGGDDAAGTLGLSDIELGRIVAGKIIIGSAGAGQIEVTADIIRTAATDIELVSGDDIIFSGGQIDTGGGTLLLHPGAPPAAVKPTKAGVDATASTVSFASDLAIAIDGTAVDADYNQLNVAGTVDLTGVDLVLSGGYVPLPGNVFTIVSATSVSGQFNGLADGDKVTFNGVQLVVHYTATAVTLTTLRGAEDVVVLGAEAGAEPRVKVLDAKGGSVVASFLAYTSAFRGGVRVAVADLNGDGTAEIIVAPGAGMSTLIKVFDLDGNELKAYRAKAYLGFSGGVFVAVGDLNGDGRPDLITSPGSGLSAQIKVFRNRVQHMSEQKPYVFTKNPLYAFLAFGATFTGGATVAAGDLTGDGRAEIVVGNGPGMGPRVRVYDLSLIPPSTPGGGINFGPFVNEILPFKTTDRGGVFVAVGDVRGNATPEIILGNGVNGRGRIEIYHANGDRSKSFTAYGNDEGPGAPVHVAAKNVDADALDEILTGQGAPGSIGRLRSFNNDGTLVDDVFEGEDDFRFGFFVA